MLVLVLVVVVWCGVVLGLGVGCVLGWDGAVGWVELGDGGGDVFTNLFVDTFFL